MNKCKYCGGEAKYQFKNGSWCCSKVFYECPGYRKSLSESAKNNWTHLKSKGYNVKADVPAEERRIQKTYYDGSICAWCGRPAIKVLKNGKGCCSEFLAQCPAIREKNSANNKDRAKSPHYRNPNLGRPSWNKGKTKETDERLVKSANTLKRRYELGEITASFKGRHHTDESKKKTSEARKKYLNEHPEKVPYLLNHSSKVSYPEQYFKELFEHENIPLQYHKQIHLYQLDFYNEELKRYVEIDGGTHELEKVKLIDKERDEYLSNLGWIGMRIKWSDYQKFDDEGKKETVSKIKEFLKQ